MTELPNRQVVLSDRNGHNSAVVQTKPSFRAPGANEVVVRVAAAGVAYGDVAIARGVFPPKPKPGITVLGIEFWGTVHQVGSNVSHLAVGDTVAGEPETGTLTDYWTGDAKRAYKISGPAAGLDPIVAAALPVSYMTAYVIIQEAKTYEHLQAVQGPLRIFIGGGSGAVGSGMIQFAKLAGWTVYTSCSASKADMVKALGADHVYDYHDKDWTKAVAADLGGDKFHFVATAHSKADTKALWKLLDAPGLHIVYGFYTEAYTYGLARLIPTIIGRMIGMKSRSCTSAKGKTQRSIAVDDISAKDQARYKENIQTLADMVHSGQLKPTIHKVYPLEQAAQALDEVASGRNRGKVVVSLLNN